MNPEEMIAQISQHGNTWQIEWNGFWGGTKISGLVVVQGKTIEEVMHKMAVNMQLRVLDPWKEPEGGKGDGTERQDTGGQEEKGAESEGTE